MNAIGDAERPKGGASGTTDQPGTVGGIHAPYGAVVTDAEALEEALIGFIDEFLADSDGEVDSGDLAASIVGMLRYGAR
ncbi:hypothetical protein [Streptomyces sp. NPDC059708]|uniref:hypothetical protein n=1 Tax=Streptomyces sp. NPDC059708 TaxID=3346916 RepID=UPI0036CC5A99